MCDEDDFDYVKRLAVAAHLVGGFGCRYITLGDTFGNRKLVIAVVTPIYSISEEKAVIKGYNDLEFELHPKGSYVDRNKGIWTTAWQTSDKKEFFNMIANAIKSEKDEFDTSIFKNLSAMEALEELEALVAEK